MSGPITQAKAHPSATTAGFGGAVTVLAFYLAGVFGWNPPAEIAAALTTVVSTLAVDLRARFFGQNAGDVGEG
jgi:hypothetical protein